ncbi:hypothetical protein [Kitasatospora sp. NPDC093558]|uniref:hypothetical protein n=1 Tax=Kitasatospora sp. NPDC093558 TaxID=3155201 RepID=UPI00341727C4
MSARTRDTKPPARPRRSAAIARAVAQGLFLLAGLATTVLGFSRFADANDVVNAYRTAPACGTAARAPGTDCVRHQTGKVTERHIASGGDSTYYYVTVADETAATHRYEANQDFYYATETGRDVDLTVFRGRVAELSSNGEHTQNPGTPWLACLEVSLLAGLGLALAVHGLTWSRMGTRVTSFASAMGVFVAAMALLGCLVLVSSQLPIAATLAIPVLGWLFMTACVTVATRDR